MKTITTINGRFVARGDDRISVFDNSLLYAEGLFETCLSVNGSILFLEDHLKRLKQGAKVIGLELPVQTGRIGHWIKKTAAAHPDSITKVRLTVTAGEAARWVGRPGPSQVIVSASPHSVPTDPYRLYVAPFRVDQDSEFRRIKTVSYAIHAAAIRLAHQRNYDDALMLNEKNQVAEVTSANIFWIKRGKVFTTPLSSGCLDGITRRKAIGELRKLKLSVTESNINLEQLARADELFVSSSLKLVLPVAVVRHGRRTMKFASGEITAKLARRFRNLAGLDNDASFGF